MWMYAAIFIVEMYALWFLFLAVMALKRAHIEGTLTRTTFILALPGVGLGYLLDAIGNAFFMSALLFELPHWNEGEILVTDRLKRIRRTDKRTGWQRDVAEWFVQILNPFDPSGPHI